MGSSKRRRDSGSPATDLPDAKRVLHEAHKNSGASEKYAGFKQKIAKLYSIYEAHTGSSKGNSQPTDLIAALVEASAGQLPCKIVAAGLLPRLAPQTGTTAASSLPTLVTLFGDTLSTRSTFATKLGEFTPDAGTLLSGSIADSCTAAAALYAPKGADAKVDVKTLTHELLWCLGALTRPRPPARASSRGHEREGKEQRAADKPPDTLGQRRNCRRALSALLQGDPVSVMNCSFKDLVHSEGAERHGAIEFLRHCLGPAELPLGPSPTRAGPQGTPGGPEGAPDGANGPQPAAAKGLCMLLEVLKVQLDALAWLRTELPTRLTEASSTNASEEVFRLLTDMHALLPPAGHFEALDKAVARGPMGPPEGPDIPSGPFARTDAGPGPSGAPQRGPGPLSWSPSHVPSGTYEDERRSADVHLSGARTLPVPVAGGPRGPEGPPVGAREGPDGERGGVFAPPDRAGDAMSVDGRMPTYGSAPPGDAGRRRKSRFDVPPPHGAEGGPGTGGPRFGPPHRGPGPPHRDPGGPYPSRMHPRARFDGPRPRYPDYHDDRGRRDYPPSRHNFRPAYPQYRGNGPYHGSGRGPRGPAGAPWPARAGSVEISCVEQASRSIWVQGIPPGVNANAVQDEFRRFAPVVDVVFPTNSAGDEGIVTFSTIMDAACGYESIFGSRIWSGGRQLDATFCAEEPKSAPHPSEGEGLHVWIAGADNPTAEAAVMTCLYDAGLSTPEVLRVAGRGPGLLLQFGNTNEVSRAIEVLRKHLLGRPPGGFGRGAPGPARGDPQGAPAAAGVWVHMVNGPVRERDILDSLRRYGEILRWQMVGPACLYAELPHAHAAADARRALDGLRFGPATIRLEGKGPPPSFPSSPGRGAPDAYGGFAAQEPGRAPSITPQKALSAANAQLPMLPSLPSMGPPGGPSGGPAADHMPRVPTFSPTRAPSGPWRGPMLDPAGPAVSATASGQAVTGTSTASSNKLDGRTDGQGPPGAPIVWEGPLAKSGAVQCRVKVLAPSTSMLVVGGAPADSASWVSPLNVSFRLPFEPVFGKDVFRGHPSSQRTLLRMEADTSDATNARGFQEFVEYLGTKHRAGVVKPLCGGRNAYLIPYSAAAAKALDLPFEAEWDAMTSLLMLITPSAGKK